MKTEIAGRIIVVGDNIDTDQIYPGRFLAITDPKENCSHCLCGVDEGIAASFPMGAAAVVADSFARIFFRNAINLGLPLIVCPGLSRETEAGQELVVDMEAGTVRVKETGKVYPCDRLGDQAMRILEAGGIKPLMRARFGKA